MNSFSHRNKQAAFTLVELATVVLLSGILLALLYGGATRARAMSDNSRCIHHLRTLGLGALRFMQDQGGTLLPSKHFTNPSFRADKPGLRDYVGINSTNIKVTAPEFLTDTAFTCPAMKRKYPGLFPSYLNRSYVSNYYAHRDEPENLDEAPAQRLPVSPDFAGKLMNVATPAQMWLFADGCVRNGSALPTYMKPSFTTAAYDLNIHGTHQNVVFLDGHVEALTREDFTQRSRRNFWGNQSATD